MRWCRCQRRSPAGRCTSSDDGGVSARRCDGGREARRGAMWEARVVRCRVGGEWASRWAASCELCLARIIIGRRNDDGEWDCCDETVEIKRIHCLGAASEHMGRRHGGVKWHFGIRFRRRQLLKTTTVHTYLFAGAGRCRYRAHAYSSNNSVHATVCVTVDSVRFGSARVVFRGYVFASQGDS